MTFVIADLPANMQNKITVEGDCWIWTGAKNSKGYGSMSDGKNRSVLAHRKAYTVTKGEIPVGLTIDHLCCTIECVNPAHLEAVTVAENLRRRYASQTHCKNGHPLSGKNLRLNVRKSGRVSRVCRVCASAHTRASLARRLERAA